MENIKTNIDKLFDQFASDSLAYNVSKRLSDSYFGTATAEQPNNGATPTSAKKRKHSDGGGDGYDTADMSLLASPLSQQQRRLNASGAGESDSLKNNHSTSSLNNSSLLNASQVSQPFEVRRLRADVLDYSTRMTQMKNELDNRTAAHQRIEYMYKSKVASLEKQLASSESKLSDSDKHLKLLRRRDAASQALAVKAKHQLTEQRCTFDEHIAQLQRAKHDVETQLRDTQASLGEQLAQLQQHSDELEKICQNRAAEINSLRERVQQLQDRSRRSVDAESRLELQQCQLEAAQRRVAELENDAAAYGEWKDLSKTYQSRAARMPELEDELERLRRDNRNLFDSIGNKLLLEEQVDDLRGRLVAQAALQEETIGLRTRLQLAEAELNDFRAVARDHCAANSTVVSPVHLRSRIEEILRTDLLLNSEKGAVHAEKESSAQQVRTLQKELEIFTKATENLQTSLKYHKTSMHRVQKKLTLVAKERDCYKQLIDNYEKDLTISGVQSDFNPESQIRIKLDMVEKSLDAYKEMCATLETELQSAKGLPDLGVEGAASGEHYERFKRDIAVLRLENETLQRRKAALELQLEHSSLKGAYDLNRFKVVHMEMNPLAEAEREHADELERLRTEVERLKRRNRKLEQDHEELTVRLNETVNVTCDLREIGAMREQIKSLDAKNKHQKELYKQASQEFREVCYMLFGFRVDRFGANDYRISSIFAENENEYLNFRFESGGLDMLVNDYSRTLADMVDVYLGERRSLPAFLCTLNLELFNRTTVAM